MDGGLRDGRTVETAGFLHPGSAGIVVPGPAGDIAIVESPDGRAYMVWVGPTGDLLAAGHGCPACSKRRHLSVVRHREGGWPLTVSDGPNPGATVELFRPHDGRTYMRIGSGDAIWVADVTYPYAPAPTGYIRDNLEGFYSLGGIGGISTFVSPDGRILALVGSGDGTQVIYITNPYCTVSGPLFI